jgi:hypothetical protein
MDAGGGESSRHGINSPVGYGDRIVIGLRDGVEKKPDGVEKYR